MSARNRIKTFRTVAISAAAAAYVLAVLGSWVRINGAGMTCPDWPLCNGALIPSLQGGVILEWAHRLLALVLSLLIVGVAVAAWRVRRDIAGVVPMAIVLAAAFVLQAGLGGVTIFQANSPPSVTMHWGAAMILLGAFTALAVLGVLAPSPQDAPRHIPASWPLLVPALAAYATMLLGAYVSSSGWGLACRDLPLCGGTLFGHSVDQAVQMLHRIAALMLFTGALYAALAAGGDRPAVRRAVVLALALVCVQIALGVANVAFALPTALREAHAANAALVFIVYIVALTLARLERATETIGVRYGRLHGSRSV